MTLYQAGPLFTDAERLWRKTAQAELESTGFKVVWPGNPLTGAQIEAAGLNAPTLIYAFCKNALEHVVVSPRCWTAPRSTTAQLGKSASLARRECRFSASEQMPGPAGETRHSRMNARIEGCLSGLGGSVSEVITMLRKS